MGTHEFHRFLIKMAAVVIAKCTWVKFLACGISCECGPGPEYREITLGINAYDAVKVSVDALRSNKMVFGKLAHVELKMCLMIGVRQILHKSQIMVTFPFLMLFEKKCFCNLFAGGESGAVFQLANHACWQYLMQRNELSFELNLGYPENGLQSAGVKFDRENPVAGQVITCGR